MLTVYLVRHGETEHNLNGVISGHLDTPLNGTGLVQAYLLAKRFVEEESVRFDLAFTSDLARARDTGAPIVRQYENDLELQQHTALRERDMGELNGTSGSHPRPLPASVESSEAFRRRCLQWWKEVTVPLAKHPVDRTVLVVTHSGFIKNLLQQLVSTEQQGGLGYAVKGQALKKLPFGPCENTAISVVSIDLQGSGVIERYNDYGHLDRGKSLLNKESGKKSAL